MLTADKSVTSIRNSCHSSSFDMLEGLGLIHALPCVALHCFAFCNSDCHWCFVKQACMFWQLCLCVQFTEAVVNLKFDEDPKYAAYSALLEPLCGQAQARPILQTDVPKVRWWLLWKFDFTFDAILNFGLIFALPLFVAVCCTAWAFFSCTVVCRSCMQIMWETSASTLDFAACHISSACSVA